jgi:hypothetical protein
MVNIPITNNVIKDKPPTIILIDHDNQFDRISFLRLEYC